MVTRPSDLKVDVGIWPDIPMSGETFTASVTMENRFPERVEVKSIEAVLPAELQLSRRTPSGATRRLGVLLGWLKFWDWYVPQSWRTYSIGRMDALRPEEVEQVGVARPPSPPLILQEGSSEIIKVPVRYRGWLFATTREHKVDFSISYRFTGCTEYHSSGI